MQCWHPPLPFLYPNAGWPTSLAAVFSCLLHTRWLDCFPCSVNFRLLGSGVIQSLCSFFPVRHKEVKGQESVTSLGFTQQVPKRYETKFTLLGSSMSAKLHFCSLYHLTKCFGANFRLMFRIVFCSLQVSPRRNSC